MLKAAGMLPGAPEPVRSVPQPAIDFPVMRESTPRARVSGGVRYHVRPGDVFRAGDLLATMTDLHGRPPLRWAKNRSSIGADCVVTRPRSPVIPDEGAPSDGAANSRAGKQNTFTWKRSRYGCGAGRIPWNLPVSPPLKNLPLLAAPALARCL